MTQLPLGEIHINADGNFVMSPDTLKSLTDYKEIDDEKTASEVSGQDYCCHNNEDGRCHVIRASNDVSAALKCMGHYVARPVTSHRGNCKH